MSNAVLREYRKQARLMGSAFEFVLNDDSGKGEEHLETAIAEVSRLENLLTEFSETSQTYKINQDAGIAPVDVDQEVFDLITRCKQIASLTQGAFDISAGVLKKLYNFKGQAFKFPTDQQIGEALGKIGGSKIDTSTRGRVLLTERGMKISFAAIGKGYAADRVKALMTNAGVKGGVINASGDLTTWGVRADGKPWKVGIADPNDKSRILLWIPVDNASVATSGDYEQYFERNGIRYSHTIDPKTGKPVAGVRSVTVVSPSAELSDALATAVFVMGVDAGVHFIEQLPNVHALIITDRNKVATTRHLKFNRILP